MGIRQLAAERDRLLIGGHRGRACALVSRGLSRLPVGGEADDMLEDSVALALSYLAHEPAKEWVAEYRARSVEEKALDERREQFLRALDLAVAASTLDDSLARSLERSVRWELLEDNPFASNLRLFLLVDRGDFEAGLAWLRNSSTEIRRPLDRANRLRILGMHFLDAGRSRRFRGFYDAAMRYLRQDRSLRARLLEIELRAWLGRVAYQNDEFAEAREHLEFVVEAARRYSHDWLHCQYACELAFIYATERRFTEASQLLRSAPRLHRSSGKEVRLERRLLQYRAHVAISAGSLREAARVAKQAQDIESPDQRSEAYQNVLLARLEIARKRGNHERALDHLNRAERSFRGLGVRGLHGLHRTLVTRGELHLRRQEAGEALRCCMKSLELARQEKFFPEQARSMLLKSYLLIEGDLPAADQVYEDVLRDLGLVRNPVLLFQVIANLYFYSWRLDDGLDLTDVHLRQLTRLRDSLDEDVYRRLYQEYVTVPVMERWMRHMGGEPPRRDRRF